MELRRHQSFLDLPSTDWNRLVADADPFLDHAFLCALERHGCLGEATGWHPLPLTVVDDDGQLVGACPLFIKTNSYGEFVFDWAWAEAYARQGLRYYPKLVSAIPFTPATGQRLLVDDALDKHTEIRRLLAEGIVELTRETGCSSAHVLFPDERELPALRSAGMSHRVGCQFHWHNRAYRDFEDFLDALSAKKRKNLRQERRRVHEAGIELECIDGTAITAAQWAQFHTFYCDTFDRRGGVPTLTLDFFRAVGSALGARVHLVLAHAEGTTVAAALSYSSRHTLYGRHWGCAAHFDSLHFEACYYQGMELCMRNGLTRFEPGAQGEHKVPRGFVPTLTHSTHWIAHTGFRHAIDDFLERETPAVARYAEELSTHLPYRHSTSAT
ncbi:GNAT family N-acetyltransferase [Plasticicumulans acidivorans]|uniref:Uncharacterized protein n=1 Tax=Plasticicumulans acidivorans TaxID=886464 RepID=A0A317MZW4_9GAMM|nr:GNAT family N-acetyltransferase [Plasticicumulans acidivorans]PWV65747.1 hypothetical protein C7443_101232 [Plasticicumulans acidivorans]